MTSPHDEAGTPARRRGLGLLALIVTAAALYFLFGSQSKPEDGPPGWDELVLCSQLTSIDSKKSLSLNEDFTARLIDRSGSGNPVVSEGRWSLLNAEQHVYEVDIQGAVGAYSAVSPPDSDGCLFAAWPLERVDLRRSWFSAAPEPPDPPDQ